ncbi:MAG: hypothetical protein ACYC4T_03250 [Melioribacteraceae bacterium]
MLRTFIASLFFLTIILTKVTSAQETNSIQINGGIISPMHSSNGYTGLIQFNYSLTPEFSFYLYSGYSLWDQHKVVYLENYSSVQKQTIFNSYKADDHVLIPVYFGSRINLHTNKLFTSYLTAELGYSYIRYSSYQNLRSVNPATGEVLKYYVDQSTRKENREDLFGLGIGAGISHSLTENLNLVLLFKLNSYINSNYSGIFSSRGTYTMFLAGFNFSI